MSASWAKCLFSSPGCARRARGFASPCDECAHATFTRAQRWFSNDHSKLPTPQEPVASGLLVRNVCSSNKSQKNELVAALNLHHNLTEKDVSGGQEQAPHCCLQIQLGILCFLTCALGGSVKTFSSAHWYFMRESWTRIVEVVSQNRELFRDFETVAQLFVEGNLECTNSFWEKPLQNEQKHAGNRWSWCNFRQSCAILSRRAFTCSPLNPQANRHWKWASNRVAGPFNFTEILPVKFVFSQ